jgi:hypothetical protein
MGFHFVATEVVCPDATNIVADLLEEGGLLLDLARDRVDHRIFN